MRPDGPRDPVAGPDSGPEAPFPVRLSGKVIQGFGRGSSELGIPTANIPLSGLSVGGHEDVESGVYYGWAGVSPCKATHQNPPGKKGGYKLMDDKIMEGLNGLLSGKGKGEQLQESEARDKGAVYPMCMSIGWNPFYKNKVRSVEVHIMHHFAHDFYGSQMNLIILGFIRPEYDYVDKDSLIDDIKTDIDVSGRSLARPPYAEVRNDPYLLIFEAQPEIAT